MTVLSIELPHASDAECATVRQLIEAEFSGVTAYVRPAVPKQVIDTDDHALARWLDTMLPTLMIEARYESCVQAYEARGITRSDAQGIVDGEDMA